MKKKTNMLWIYLVILCMIIGVLIVVYIKQEDKIPKEEKDNQVLTQLVSKHTIRRKVSGAGEIKTSLSENRILDSYKYVKECLVGIDDVVKKGQPLLQYTNGKYVYAPYDLLVTELVLPEKKGISTTKDHYIGVQRLDVLLLEMSVDESEIADMQVGQIVEIVLNAFEGKKYQGTITKINQKGEYAPKGSSFHIIVSFGNDDSIKLGMSASANIMIQEAVDVIAVPVEAVQIVGDKKYVRIQQENGESKLQEVVTGISDSNFVEIKSGLNEGDNIQVPTEEKSDSHDIYEGTITSIVAM